MEHSISGRERLTNLCREFFENFKERNPVFATSLGDRRFDDRLADISLNGRREERHQNRGFAKRAQDLDETSLGDSERLTRTALMVELNSQIDYSECGLEDWTVDPLRGPQVEFLNLESLQPVRTPSEASSMIKRWQAMAPFLLAQIENLKGGINEGKLSVKICVEKTIDEIQELLTKGTDEWALLKPLSVPHEDWSEKQRRDFETGLKSAVRDQIRPAFVTYLQFLNKEIIPRARSLEKPGIMHVPGGPASYERLIKVHTSLDLTADELHKTGLEETARINREMVNLGEKVFGTRDREKILERLRNDRSLYFSSRDEVAEKAEQCLAKAKAAIPNWFGRLPIADCVVMRMEEHEEKHSTIAYYMGPAPDGSRPGRYYINTSQPETRPRYEAEALAYHESIPGHHLQIAIAQELEDVPDFRKHLGVTAFVEGWGLYAERLANEMSLYSSDLDRLGMLSYDAWRACRLVVDSGMHAKGWTREQAINFMWENSALAKNNIVNEVDRYITWPGQALAYKTGQLQILKLRQEAKDRLGDRFDIRRFHEVLLTEGALPLAAIGQIIKQYAEH